MTLFAPARRYVRTLRERARITREPHDVVAQARTTGSRQTTRPVHRPSARSARVRRPSGEACRRQRGSITAETAVAFPALVIVLAVALWGVSAAAAQVACVDAARAGARAAARGEPQSEVRAAVLKAAPPNAHVSLSHDPTTTRVVVRAEARPLLKGLFPALRLNAQAVAAAEPEGGEPEPDP
ncbi:TadE family type IV pilus minor pilin [Actinomadura sp. DC4]|uniref:TadE family type IV pilus minor pilin n=1 Tax=Actinomadura sp. DC4 TaxID=3055069 RepID=UPI0025B1530C|nr:TadE family type IV pilus minor pilin [Actinomadura sp. DC4]MDN3354548.1 TadE family type IV pilus minor pilin [Actinomadura sp. DC4]